MCWNPRLDTPSFLPICYIYWIFAHFCWGATSYMDFFESLSYDHVNFIFAGTPHLEDAYSSVSMGYYKFGYYEPGLTHYHSNDHHYGMFDHAESSDDYRRPFEPCTLVPDEEQTTIQNQHSESSSRNLRDSNIDCPRNHNSSSTDYQTPWVDNIDPDNMTYEELLELGETVGTQSRGLSPEQISMLPVSKFKWCFLRRRSRSERCVICQMEYRRGDRIITLPCKHKYHASCGSKWLNINKACPICYTEVSITAP